MKKFIFMPALAAALFMSACSSGENDEEPEISSDNEEVEVVEIDEVDEEAVEAAETDNYQIGEAVELNGITVTINDAYLTDERNDTSIIDVSGVLVLDVTYENGSDGVFPAGRDITLEAGGEHVRSYDMDSNLPADLAPGESITGHMAYGLVKAPEDVVAVFEPLMNDSGENAIFDVEIE